MANGEAKRSGGGAGTWMLALLVGVVLLLVVWLLVVRPRGDDSADINVEVNVPDAGGGNNPR